MITYLIGLVDEVRPVKNTNRQTGEITQTLEVTVTYSSHDLDGYKVFQFPTGWNSTLLFWR